MHREAILILDYINDIVHENGAYAKEGYYLQVKSRKSLENTARAISYCRNNNIEVIYVIVGFSNTYKECPKSSRVFKTAQKEKRLILNTWATEIHDSIKPDKSEVIISKNRISSFYQTNLELILRNKEVNKIYLTGVSTEFVVLSTAIDAHDRDFRVVVLEDAVSSSHEKIHYNALNIIEKFAEISTVDDLISGNLKN